MKNNTPYAYRLEYTKLDGTRNSLTYTTEAEAVAARDSLLGRLAETGRSNHNPAATINGISYAQFFDLRPLTAKQIHSERCQAAYRARIARNAY